MPSKRGASLFRFVKEAEEKADNILCKNIEHLHKVAEALLEFESISGNEMERIIKGEKIVKLDDVNVKKVSSRRSSNDKTQSS